jgi:eukaryotic-like serine/threonine-protein kinase
VLETSQDDLLFFRLQRALVGRYSLERQIGRGGMGVVFLARDVRLDRPVAIKLLRPDIAGQPAFRERFLNEARTAARLSHPHLVSIHAVEEADDLVYFVMAYIEGETLGERIRRQGPLHSDEASRVLREVAWALSYAHASGVIHRDIKADNVLLERATGRALLADFGIAQAIGSTDAEYLAGTTTYLSPELIEGGPASVRSDLYALGVAGFLAVSGRLPFDGATGAEVMARHLAQPVPRVDEAAPGISARLACAIDRCLAKQPEGRFSSAEDFAAALEHHATVAPVQPAVIQHWLRRWDRIAPVYAIAMPVIGLRLLLDSWTTLYGFDYSRYRWTPIWAWPESLLLLALAAQAIFSFMALRRVFGAGYTREDLIVALRTSGRGVTQPERPGPLAPLPARLIRDGTYIAIGSLAIASLALRTVMGQIVDRTQAYYVYDILVGMIVTARLAAYIGLGIGVVYPGRYPRPDNWWQRLQERFWRSPLGAGAARLARIGLHPRLAEQTIHRPTEMALSLAADQLFDALPAALQAALGDVPSLVKTLERQATTLRATIEELEAAGVGTDSGDDPDRQALVELRGTTEHRHGEVIGALERVRLQLIRLAAGAIQPPELTDVLLAARKLETDLGRAVAGQESVHRLLRRRHLSSATPSPSPA